MRDLEPKELTNNWQLGNQTICINEYINSNFNILGKSMS